MGEDLITQHHALQQDVVLETADHALATLATMIDSKSIDLAPQFQRRDRWDVFKQSQLVESFVLNIPVPPIYLAEGTRGRYDVIDGKQRLTAIGDYISGRFALRGLDRFPDLSGYRFDDLPPDIQSTLNFRPLRTVTLLRQSSSEAKYEVFHRLNSGGQVLNAQEIRNVLYRGDLNDAIYKLSEEKFLKRQLKIASSKSPAYKKMTDAEWVLRFMTLLSSWKDFSGDYRKSMDTFMDRHQHSSEREIRHFQSQFRRSLEGCERIFGRQAFKRPEGNGWRDQALAGLYDAQMVAVAEISDSKLESAVRKKRDVVGLLRDVFRNDEEFDQSNRQATNTPNRVRYRVSRMIEILEAAP